MMYFHLILRWQNRSFQYRKIEKEVQLADSGYGQGQILVNPLHMACMYSAFCNEGNMIKPYLTYKEDAMPDVWIKEAFTKDVAQTVLEDTKEVINNSHGTGYAAHRTDIILAGKRELQKSKHQKMIQRGLNWDGFLFLQRTRIWSVLL